MVPLGHPAYIGAMTSLRKPARVALLALAVAAAPFWAAAQSLVSTGQSFVHASLVPGRVEPDGSQMAGLVLDLAPQWKTYWRNPGAAGVPPRFDWSRSRNLASAEVLWPRPKLFESFGMTTIGYADRVVFPLRLVPEVAGEPIELALDLAVGVCHDICVLEEAEVALHIDPAGPAAEADDEADDGAALIAAAEATVPRPGAELGLARATCRISGTGSKRSFDATLDFGRPLADAKVILEGPDLAWFEDVVTTPEQGQLNVSAKLALIDGSAWVNRSQVRMTVLADGIAADVRGCSAPSG